MGLRVVQSGDDWRARPGTSNQSGNTAPRFSWTDTSEGRFGRILSNCCAYVQGYTDDGMAIHHSFPSAKSMGVLFIETVPWFPDLFDWTQYHAAVNAEFPLEKLNPFSGANVENRCRYAFAKPGSRGHDPKARLYGISDEHHMSTLQAEAGGRLEVWIRCSTELLRRLRNGLPVSRKEAQEWGAKSVGKIKLLDENIPIGFHRWDMTIRKSK